MNQVALLDLGVLIYFMRVTAAHRLRLLRSDKCNGFFPFYYCLAIILHVSSVNTETNKSRTISEYRISQILFLCLSRRFISFHLLSSSLSFTHATHIQTHSKEDVVIIKHQLLMNHHEH